jgi:primosomal protein N'
MVHIECPWCDGQLTLDEERDALDCATCSIDMEFAPDPAPTQSALAA